MVKHKDINYSLYKLKAYMSCQLFFKITLSWFTLSDYGVLIKNIKDRPLLFSERGNFYYQYKIGNWYFRILGLIRFKPDYQEKMFTEQK